MPNVGAKRGIYGVYDRRRGSVHRQLAYSGGTTRTCAVPGFLEQYSYRWNVSAGRDDVVRDTIIGHLPIRPELYVLEQGVAYALYHAACDLAGRHRWMDEPAPPPELP